jgi:Ca2+-binding EF-hand superfamily protein
MTTQFHAVFAEVDINNDSIIDETDLRTYAQKKGLKEDVFVKKWLRLFDDDQDGIIHENDFRSKLGMNPRTDDCEEIVEARVSKAQQSGRQRKSDNGPRVLKVDMRDDLQRQMVETLMSHSGHKVEKDMKVWDLEQQFNEKYHGMWHVKVNPTPEDLKNVKYDKDGMMHVAFLDEGVEMLIWRNDPRKNNPLCCFCF